MKDMRPPVETERAHLKGSRRSRVSEALAIALLTMLIVGCLSATLLPVGPAIGIGAVCCVVVAFVLLAARDRE